MLQKMRETSLDLISIVRLNIQTDSERVSYLAAPRFQARVWNPPSTDVLNTRTFG